MNFHIVLCYFKKILFIHLCERILKGKKIMIKILKSSLKT